MGVTRKMNLTGLPRLFLTAMTITAITLGGLVDFRSAQAEGLPFETINCDGEYSHHLQGVCTDGKGTIFWSFTTKIVSTDSSGKVLKEVSAPNHQGDLCYHDGAVYVAVNLGRFNQPAGLADSWVFKFDPATLKEMERFPVPEVVHGAGGIDFNNGKFIVVGGLPKGTNENYAYEYTPEFKFVKRHVLASGETLMGIQTAVFHAGSWWFGCYGKPSVLLKASPDFQMQGKFEFDGALGMIGLDKERFLVARGPKPVTPKMSRGQLIPAKISAEKGLELVKQP